MTKETEAERIKRINKDLQKDDKSAVLLTDEEFEEFRQAQQLKNKKVDE